MLTTTYARWQAILERRLDPIVAIITRRIAVRGDRLTLLRYVKSAKQMVRCAASVPATFHSPELVP